MVPAASFSRTFWPKNLGTSVEHSQKYKFWREEAILLTIKIDIYQDLVLKLTFPHFFGSDHGFGETGREQ